MAYPITDRKPAPDAVLFLDFDGVMLPVGRGATGYAWSRTACAALQHILKETPACIVLSATMRSMLGDHMDQTGFEWMLRNLGIPRAAGRVVGRTGEGPSRHDEIARWLNEHPETKRYVVIDDDDDQLPRGVFVQPHYEVGLTMDDAARVVAILNGPGPWPRP